MIKVYIQRYLYGDVKFFNLVLGVLWDVCVCVFLVCCCEFVIFSFYRMIIGLVYIDVKDNVIFLQVFCIQQ